MWSFIFIFEKLLNNIVVCITNCVENDHSKSNELAIELTETNIIMDLLYLTRDGFNIDMRKNCGRLIAHLTKKDER